MASALTGTSGRLPLASLQAAPPSVVLNTWPGLDDVFALKPEIPAQATAALVGLTRILVTERPGRPAPLVHVVPSFVVAWIRPSVVPAYTVCVTLGAMATVETQLLPSPTRTVALPA
jgi:hypothetical protein